jgi:hypothetical protein
LGFQGPFESESRQKAGGAVRVPYSHSVTDGIEKMRA